MAETIVTDRALDARPRVLSWTSIFTGWLVALGLAWVLYVLGLAVGFSALDVNDPEVAARGIGIGTAAWVVLTWAVSLFLGAMFATWVDGRSDVNAGTLHGVAVWGLASTVTVLLAAVGFSNVLQGAGSLLGGVTRGAATATASVGKASDASPQVRVSSLLAAQIRRAAQGPGSPAQPQGSSVTANASPGAGATASGSSTAASGSSDSSAAVAADLLGGRTDDAKARLMADTGLSSADADRAIQSLAPQVEQYKTKVKEAADTARRYTAAAMWITFLSSIISLIAAAIGGALGAGHVHRIHDWALR